MKAMVPFAAWLRTSLGNIPNDFSILSIIVTYIINTWPSIAIEEKSQRNIHFFEFCSYLIYFNLYVFPLPWIFLKLFHFCCFWVYGIFLLEVLFIFFLRQGFVSNDPKVIGSQHSFLNVNSIDLHINPWHSTLIFKF